MEFVLAALGLLLLFLAGDWLVRGAVSAGLQARIPVVIIGLTIVAFGTSAPELFVTVLASINETPEIALGNVVGSNIANILLVIGLPALLSPLGDSSIETKRNYLIMIGVTFVSLMMVIAFSELTIWHGILLLALLGLFLFDTYWSTRRAQQKALEEGEDVHDVEFEEIAEADPNMPTWKVAGFIALGMIGLPFGAWLTVENATIIARDAGLSEEVIGLTLVAIGTSLPELATTVMAAVRGRADVAIGNVIGSNIFNLLAILGVAATLDPLTVPSDFVNTSVMVMVVAALLLAPFIWLNRPVGRFWGGAFFVSYLAYIAVVLQPATA